MAKVESIDDHEKRKQARMKKIMSATKVWFVEYIRNSFLKFGI